MSREKSYENIPYGPLTRNDFVLLASSYYSGGSNGNLLAVIKRRGITKEDFVRLHLAESGINGNSARTQISKPDLGGSGVGQAGIELPE